MTHTHDTLSPAKFERWIDPTLQFTFENRKFPLKKFEGKVRKALEYLIQQGFAVDPRHTMNSRLGSFMNGGVFPKNTEEYFIEGSEIYDVSISPEIRRFRFNNHVGRLNSDHSNETIRAVVKKLEEIFA